MAGHPLHGSHLRSRKHFSRAHAHVARNVTARAPAAKAGPMTLVDKYAGKNFFEYVFFSLMFNLSTKNLFSDWDFFTAADPTHGNVQYVGKDEALGSGLAAVGDDNVVVMAVDDKNPVPVGGQRKSYVYIPSRLRHLKAHSIMSAFVLLPRSIITVVFLSWTRMLCRE